MLQFAVVAKKAKSVYSAVFMLPEKNMIIWNKPIPPLDIDYGIYRPFIKNEWFRKHYMWFAYGLMVVLFVAAYLTGGFRAGNIFTKVGVYLVVYPIHELLHISMAFTKGDIYLSHSGLYFWLTPNAELKKGRYWLFMTLPMIILTGLTGIAAVFTTGTLSEYLRYIAWINAITAGSDIINSFLILIKPARSSFIRGFYRPG